MRTLQKELASEYKHKGLIYGAIPKDGHHKRGYCVDE